MPPPITAIRSKLRISLVVSPLPYDKIAVEVLNLTTSRWFFVGPAGRRAAPARFPRVRHQPASGFREIPRSRIILRHLQEPCHDAAPLRPLAYVPIHHATSLLVRI